MITASRCDHGDTGMDTTPADEAAARMIQRLWRGHCVRTALRRVHAESCDEWRLLCMDLEAVSGRSDQPIPQSSESAKPVHQEAALQSQPPSAATETAEATAAPAAAGIESKETSGISLPPTPPAISSQPIHLGNTRLDWLLSRQAALQARLTVLQDELEHRERILNMR